MNEEKYIHEQHTVHHILSLIIWCSKRRRRVLVDAVAERLEQIIQLAIQPDHVHLFIQSNPYTLPTDIPRLMKCRSSHELREEFLNLMRMPSLWTHSTFYSTAGHVSQDVIDTYIERQSKV